MGSYCVGEMESSPLTLSNPYLIPIIFLFRWVCVVEGNQVEVGEVAQTLMEVAREPVEMVVEKLTDSVKEVLEIVEATGRRMEVAVQEAMLNMTTAIGEYC